MEMCPEKLLRIKPSQLYLIYPSVIEIQFQSLSDICLTNFEISRTQKVLVSHSDSNAKDISGL